MLFKEHELYAEVHPTLNADINIEKLKSKSNKKIWWLCPRNHSYLSKINNRVSLGRGCKYCTGQVPIPGESDLATTHPTLAEELEDQSLATSLSAKSNKKVAWVCPEKGHIYFAVVYSRATGTGCGYCSRRYPYPGETDLATTNPQMASELEDTTLATSLMENSSKRVWWRCPKDPNHRYHTSPNIRTSKGTGCPQCRTMKVTHPQFFGQLVDPETYEDLSYGSTEKVEWECENNHKFFARPNHRIRKGLTPEDGCIKCSGNRTSKGENQLQEYVKTHFPDAQFNARGIIDPRLELDIYIPSLKLAIEYNGVYYHSEKFIVKDHHKRKLQKCLDAGVRLLVVWEDDWVLRQQVVLQMINHKLGISSQEKVPARKTTVTTLTYQQASEFLNKNHIQGSARGSYYLGLIPKDSQDPKDLLAVMVLRRVKDTLLLERYATSKIVSGGQSKLLSYVDSAIEYTQMVTFADLSISDGSLYEKTGWTKDKELPPDYSYLYKNRRTHKFNFRKERFKNNPELKFEEGLTESQLAHLNNLYRVYDYGKVRYVR